MHLSVDSSRSLADVRAALLPALAARGLRVERVTTTPGGGFVVEVADPLPSLDAARDDARALTTYKIAGYARDGGGARLSTLNPTHLVELMDRPLSEAPARALEKALTAALFAAAGRDGELRGA